MRTTCTGHEEFCKYAWWRKAILVHQLDCSWLVHALHGPGIDTRIGISPVCNQTQAKIGLCERKCCVSLARWSLNYENSFVLPKLTPLSLALSFCVQGVYASTPSNSGGRGDFGCLLSKCCLKVFGSGIWDCRKEEQKYFRQNSTSIII